MKKSLVGIATACMLAACSAPRDANQPLEVWTNFEQATVSNANLGENQSLAVFYRQDNINGGAANIYIDGNYQASLLPNAYTPVAVCSDKHLFSTSFSTNQQFGNRTSGIHHTLPVGEVAYIKLVQEANGKLNFVRMDSEIAKEEIANLPKENQTLSRVPAPNNCGTPVLANAALDASALFPLNKAGYNDILPNGKQDIINFAQGLATMSNVSGLKVSGHTDPEGSDSYNKVLSQKRAETVKAALKRAGVTLPIEAVGYGEAQPVVSHCGSLKGKAKAECNLPNRRVEITVYGNK